METLREQYLHILLSSFSLRRLGNESTESSFDCHSLFTPPGIALRRAPGFCPLNEYGQAVR